MKKTVIVICFSLVYLFSSGQDENTKSIKLQIDTLISRIEVEKDDDKRFDLLYVKMLETGLDIYPVVQMETSQKLMTVSQRTKDKMTAAVAWSFAGQSYRLTGNYIKALECHHKAAALAEQTGNRSLLGVVQNQTAHIYKDREEYGMAKKIYLSAAENVASGKNKWVHIWPALNLGYVYLGTNQLDSSLYYSRFAANKILQLKTDKYSSLLTYIYQNIAGAYSKKGMNDSAVWYFRLSDNEVRKSSSPRFSNILNLAMAEHYQRNNIRDSAIYYAKKASELVQNTIFSYLALKPAKLLTDMYENSNADSTLKYLKIYRAANDSLFSSRANQQLQFLTFEEEQRQQELAAQKINYQNKIRTYLLLSGLIIFSVIALLLYRNNKQKQQANLLLQQQKTEIQNTLAQLKATQAQLVQSEKMASLGELTAGIAHEIQNPLNFVNNFSEVSNELIEELKSERSKVKSERDEQLEDELLDDISKNLEKINHHGKRADAIVKGMLQHSRSSSGQKEPTDINALCDEYLRLSYHGLRAKDKSFNATINTDFDHSIEKINIIPQDVGRVILNLLTNAFYAVSEKKQQNIPGYEPTVTVSTKKINDQVEIKVADNGNGIPKKVLDKIFQPFFTTKPTGQGTGLGLSLSYDIITKGHGGKLKVNTQENEGTEFIIHLSLKNTP
jgi:two-component system NtrC family sensor kinase